MKQTYNVLIIENHQIIIDTFKNALSFLQNELEDVEFTIDEAINCESAFEKIKNASERENIDLIFLGIQLPNSTINKIYSGEDLGVIIKKLTPKAKIIVCTSLTDNFRLNSYLKKFNPRVF